MEERERWRALHVVQDLKDSCIAACTCIVLRWRGEPTAETELIELWGRVKYYLSVHAAPRLDALPGFLDPTDPTSYPVLERLVAGGPCVLEMMSGPWTLLQRARASGAIASRHGDMKDGRPASWIEREPLPHHAVVAVGVVDAAFLILDPYYPDEGQPWCVARTEMVPSWTGNYLPGERR